MMKIIKSVPSVSTSDVKESKDFYTKHFGFKVIFDCNWYVSLQSQDGKVEIAFMEPQIKDRPLFAGHGLSYGFEVKNVDKEYDRLSNTTINIIQAPTSNPWGDRSFIVLDPNGIAIYIYQKIEVAEEHRTAIKL